MQRATDKREFRKIVMVSVLYDTTTMIRSHRRARDQEKGVGKVEEIEGF